jgi:predicted DNA-binding transcriptional regulator AlpA
MPVFQNNFASEWLDSRQLAAEIGVAAVTLKAWRAVGTGPAYVKVGRLIRYRRSAVAAWLASRTVTSAGPVGAS